MRALELWARITPFLLALLLGVLSSSGDVSKYTGRIGESCTWAPLPGPWRGAPC